MSITEKQLEEIARLVDRLVDLTPASATTRLPINLLSCEIKSALVRLRTEPLKKKDKAPLPTRSALVALEECFRSAEAGGFDGDTESLTRRQTEAADAWIQAAKAWLK